MENNHTCEICNVDVHRASMQKHLRSKKHLEKLEQNEIIIPEWFFKEEKTPIKKKIQKVYNPKTLKQLAREKIKLDDKEFAKMMISPYYFIDRNLKNGFKINLDSHNISHANSILTITCKYPDIGIEYRYINGIVKELSVIYSRLINQYKFKYHTLFSASFYKINEEDQRDNEIEIYINLKINKNLTESDIDNIDVRSQLEHQIQIQETKDSGWIFDKINSMKISFYKTTELDGTSYVKIPLRSNAILNIRNNDKYCFIWSILASLHPCENTHPSRVNNYIQYFNELNFQSFDFTNGFKCSDIHKFNELNNLSVNIYELNFYQDGDKWKHNLIPTEISKNDSDKVIDLLIYKNHYALIKKLHVFLGDDNKSFVCRRCLNSYTCENALINHKEKCGDDNICTIRTSNESHLYWKKHFHKNPLYFRIIADFEADNEKDDTKIGNKTTNIYKQKPVLNGYYIISELNDVLESGYYESPLGYDNVDWFVKEVIKLENKMTFYFKNTKKDIIMTKENEEGFKNNKICRFCEKEILSDKVRDHCQLTGKYRGPAHNTCNINVKQKDSNFIPFAFHNFSNYDCHMFFKRLVDLKKDKVKFKIIPKTNEVYISVKYGCIRFIDSYRFLSESLDKLVKNLDENDFKILKKEFPDKWQYLNKKLAYPYEYFNSINDYKKPVNDLKKEDFFSKLKNDYPDDDEIERTKGIIKLFNIKDGEQLTRLYCKTDVILLADVFEKFVKVSTKEYKINPLYCVSLPGYTYQCALKYTDIKLQTLQDKDLILLIEKNIRGGISSVMGDRYVKSDEDNNILYIDATNLYGHSMSQMLPYDEIEIWHGHPDKYWNWLEEILNTPDDSEIGYFLEVDLKYPDNLKQKTKYFPFCPENKKIDSNNYNEYMNTIKPENYTKSKKLICDWTDKKKYLIHYRMLKFYFRHGMIVKKIHEIISFKQSKWLEGYISFNTQKRNKAKNDFEKDFFKLLVNAASGKFLENIRNRLNLELIKKDNIKKIVYQQSKLTFNGIQKTYESYYSFTYKKNEIVMDKAIYVGFAILELSKLHMYETYYDTLQPYFGQENLQLHYVDTDGMILSMKTKDIIKDLKNLEDIFDFSNLDKKHELYSEKNKKVIGKFKIETPKNIIIDEFVCLRSKAYSFKCKNNDENKNKIKGISKSQSKHIKFEEYYICLFGREYQRECSNYIIRSINHEMVLQEVKKSTLSIFDDKRYYINNIESKPWN